jgi:hypothetical protein
VREPRHLLRHFNGIKVWFGRADDPGTRKTFDAYLARWLANDRRSLEEHEDDEHLTVEELVDRFQAWADAYYVKDGEPTREASIIEFACKPLTMLYGTESAATFGPPALRAVREDMIRRKWSRKNINRQVGRVRRVFKWAVERELVPPSISHALACVAPLKRGRTEAKERKPVAPIAWADVEAVLPCVSNEVRAIELG